MSCYYHLKVVDESEEPDYLAVNGRRVVFTMEEATELLEALPDGTTAELVVTDER